MKVWESPTIVFHQEADAIHMADPEFNKKLFTNTMEFQEIVIITLDSVQDSYKEKKF